MEKMRWLKKYKNSKIGEIFNAGEKSAENFVSQGYAEYIEEPKTIKKKKPIKKEAIKKEIEEDLPVMTATEIQNAVKELLTVDNIDKGVDDLVLKSGKRKNRIIEMLENLKKESNPKEMLKEQAKEEELDNYKHGEINWMDNDFYDDWKKVRGHMKKLWDHGEEYDGIIPDWFFLAHYKDEVIGRPQLIENVQKRIPLVRCAVKTEKGKTKDDDDEERKKFYFFDEKFDKRYHGSQVDAFALDFKMYRVISKEEKEYYIMSQQDLPNQVCTFKGMLVELDDFAEISRSMKISSLSRIFFVKEFEPSIKILTPEQIIKYTKNREITEKDWLNFLAYHKLGTSNRFPYESEMLRSSHLLSSKVDEVPQHLGVMGPAGTRKSMGYIETIAYKFSETPNIVEGANSRIKGLTPSFAVKPANLGYLAKCERIGWVDELGKMVESESTKHQSNTKNILGELNALLDNKIREVNSGNDNTCSVQATAKFTFVLNPIGGKKTLNDHVGLMDPTTMSRIFWWVQDEDEQKFVISSEGITKIPPTMVQASQPGPIALKRGVSSKKGLSLGNGWGGCMVEDIYCSSICSIDNREEFLTLFDTCNAFICKIDDDKVEELTSTITQLAREPMKSVWKPRGAHHVKLLIDGLIKHRCLFKDYDETFTAKQEDYDIAERILIRMVKGWGIDLSNKFEYVTSS